MKNIANQNDLMVYKKYVEKECSVTSEYCQNLNEFLKKITKDLDKYIFHDFLDFLVDNQKFNKNYYDFFLDFFDYLSQMNLIKYEKIVYHYASLDFYKTKYKQSIEQYSSKDIDSYEFNNFIKEDSHSILEKIKNKNVAVWLSGKGKICIRFSSETEPEEYTMKYASDVLSNFLNLDIKFVKNASNINDTDKEYICTNDLLLIQKDVFNPHVYKEFFQVDGLWYRNIFKPSQLLQINRKLQKLPYNIFHLISHLVNYDKERYFIFINWLASFFQTLKKSQVAILFKGEQGAGKGTLFKIMERLFGKVYCKQINGDSLKSNYLGSFLENSLLLNCDEIDYMTVGKSSFSGYLKAIITNDEVTAEKKNINMVKATPIFAQVVLFSNADVPIEIEPSDRRFTVFTTAENLQNTNFFNHGNFSNLEEAIEKEIDDFAMYLKLYKVDEKEANSVFWTQEKELMINKTDNNLQFFVDAILENNIFYFEKLRNTNIALYNMFTKQLFNGKVYQKHLILIYMELYPDDKYISSARSLIKQIEIVAPNVFGDHNLYKSNGDKYYKLLLEEPIENNIYVNAPRPPFRPYNRV